MNTLSSRLRQRSFFNPIIFVIFIQALTFFANPAMGGEAEKAEFSLHLFQQGSPIEEVELIISSESFDK